MKRKKISISIVRQDKPGVSAAPQEPAAAGDRHPRPGTPDVHIRIDTQLICRETLAEQQKEAEAP